MRTISVPRISRTRRTPASPHVAKPYRYGTPDHDGVGSYGQGLHDVAASSDTAVEHDRGCTTEGVDDVGEHPQGGRGPVELAAPVVRHDDGIAAGPDGATGVVGTEHTLHGQGPGPLPPDGGDVVPRERRRPHGDEPCRR